MPKSPASKLEEKRKMQMVKILHIQKQEGGLQTNPESHMGHHIQIMEGYQGHYKTINKKNFRAKDGTIVMDDKSNMKILKEHYHKVFNHKVNIDEKVLEHLEQRTMAQEL